MKKLLNRLYYYFFFFFLIGLFLQSCGRHSSTVSNKDDLANLVISAGTLNPVFDPTVTNYSVEVPYAVSSVVVTPISAEQNSTIKVNNAAITSGYSSSAVQVNTGDNVITISVLAEDGTTSKIYTVAVQRAVAPSSNADLANLVVSSGTLNPGFDPTVTNYSIEVPYAVSSVVVTPTSANSTIKVNNATVTSGYSSSAIPINSGDNIVTILVLAQDGTTSKIYTVDVQRLVAPSNNADLANLVVSSGTLNPVFDPAVTSYSVEVPYTVSSVVVTPTSAGINSTIKINNAAITSGYSSSTIQVNTGDNIITISVLAEDGTTSEIYTLDVKRLVAPSSNADLANLVISSGTLTPGFDPATTNYSVDVPYTVSSVLITPTSAGINSTIKVNNVAVTSGSSSSAIQVNTGDNIMTILIMAEDGTTSKIYTVDVTVLPSYQATIVKSAKFDNSTSIQFVGEDTSNTKILALQPLVNEIFATYGNPTTNLDKARAIRDFVARNAVHPFDPYHENTVSDSSVLPTGSNWSEFISIFSNSSRVSADSSFWSLFYLNGYNMLNSLLGTVNLSTLVRNDDGMMTKLAPGKYQIRNYTNYHAVLCTWQQYMFIDLLASAGLHGMQVRTDKHDPGAVFIPELKKWIWEDPTFNEEFTLDGNGDPLSPEELFTYSILGYVARLSPLKSRGPDWDMSPYINLSENYPYNSYFTYNGPISTMGAQINNRIIDNSSWKIDNVQLNTYLFSSSTFSNYSTASSEQMFPQLGVKIVEIKEVENGYQVTLDTSFPNHYKYFRQTNSGSWAECSSVDVIPFTPGFYSYRSVDMQNNHGMDAIVNLIKI